jgi:RNA polymerase sigma factor (sigma-70 family)
LPVKTAKAPRNKAELKIKSDRELVLACLGGDEAAWSELLAKYKNLIFSIPVRYGFSREESADIFQAVCLELIQQLGKVREPDALPKWIIQVTSHKCFHAKRQNQRLVYTDDEENPVPETAVPPDAEFHLRELEEERLLREAMNQLSSRCLQLVETLFFEEPKRPYQEVASSLGLATGSIGLMRQKCLERLRKSLDSLGF